MNSKEAKALDKNQLISFINDLRCIQCDHYVNGNWSEYDGKMYCQECWDINRAEETRVRIAEIAALKKRLAKLSLVQITV